MPSYQMNFIDRIKHLTSISTDARLAFRKHMSPPDYAALLNLIDEPGHRGDAAESLNVYACIFKDDVPRRLGDFAVLSGMDLAYLDLMMNPGHKSWDHDLLRTAYDIRLTVCTRFANEDMMMHHDVMMSHWARAASRLKESCREYVCLRHPKFTLLTYASGVPEHAETNGGLRINLSLDILYSDGSLYYSPYQARRGGGVLGTDGPADLTYDRPPRGHLSLTQYVGPGYSLMCMPLSDGSTSPMAALEVTFQTVDAIMRNKNVATPVYHPGAGLELCSNVDDRGRSVIIGVVRSNLRTNFLITAMKAF